MNNYINISSDDGSIFSIKNEEPIFISPKINNKNGKNLFSKITQYSLNNNNDNGIYYTDLKKGLNNIKVKSTNFASNVSYDIKEHKNNHKNKKGNISPLNKISIFNVNKNKKVKKLKFHDSMLIDNKKKNKTENKKPARKIPIHRSTIQFCKTLKTIDEYMELKRNKSKNKNSHPQPKKKENNQHNLSNNKRNLNKSNKKERIRPRAKESRKSHKKLINFVNIDNLNDDNDTIKDNNKEQIEKKNSKNLNNEDKKSSPKMIKKNKSNPKIKNSKSIFHSFLICFGCSNFDNCDDIKSNCKNINNSPDDKVINIDIDNKKLNDKKGKNKINKKKRIRKISDN